MKLTTTLKTVSVEIEGADGIANAYTIKELTGAEREKYLDTVSARMKYVGDKPVGFTTYEGSYTKLLAMCLYDSTGAKVNVETIKQWPQSTVEALFKEAQSISGLIATAEGEAKNG
jgi:hypothetical protein